MSTLRTILVTVRILTIKNIISVTVRLLTMDLTTDRGERPLVLMIVGKLRI